MRTMNEKLTTWMVHWSVDFILTDLLNIIEDIVIPTDLIEVILLSLGTP